MAKIIAEGIVEGKKRRISITGGASVQSIECNDRYLKMIFSDYVENARGQMANAYAPPASSMLQAYLFCADTFAQDEIRIEGEIEPIEYESGVIY